eukprot:scaffold161338_cov31-Tisochrysis_lutea.AAC.4
MGACHAHGRAGRDRFDVVIHMPRQAPRTHGSAHAAPAMGSSGALVNEMYDGHGPRARRLRAHPCDIEIVPRSRPRKARDETPAVDRDKEEVGVVRVVRSVWRGEKPLM